MHSTQEMQKWCIHNYMSGLVSAYISMGISKEESINKAIEYARNQISEESPEDAVYLNGFLENWIKFQTQSKSVNS